MSKLTEISYHEALDRAYIVNHLLATHLVDHPVITKHKKLKRKIQMASDLLYEVYNDLGGLSVDKFGPGSIKESTIAEK
jgi:hypothetical protein